MGVHLPRALAMFLMYRVELKGNFSCARVGTSALFLMYRVELKDALKIFNACIDVLKVPNVPCGVERLLGGA